MAIQTIYSIAANDKTAKLRTVVLDRTFTAAQVDALEVDDIIFDVELPVGAVVFGTYIYQNPASGVHYDDGTLAVDMGFVNAPTYYIDNGQIATSINSSGFADYGAVGPAGSLEIVKVPYVISSAADHFQLSVETAGNAGVGGVLQVQLLYSCAA